MIPTRELQRTYRRATQGHWEPSPLCFDCCRCGSDVPVNILGYCANCAFVLKLPSLTILAEPWALREVRRQYGHAGESDRRDRYRKDAHAEEMTRRYGAAP